jgi:hypothetical protein
MHYMLDEPFWLQTLILFMYAYATVLFAHLMSRIEFIQDISNLNKEAVTIDLLIDKDHMTEEESRYVLMVSKRLVDRLEICDNIKKYL